MFQISEGCFVKQAKALLHLQFCNLKTFVYVEDDTGGKELISKTAALWNESQVWYSVMK